VAVIGAARRTAAIDQPAYTHVRVDLANVGDLENQP
jgi:hypothetical protein